MLQDLYQTLGVSKTATAAEIKKAYRKLVQKHHPDKKTGDEKKFKEIGEAYAILTDKEKRQMYDQFGVVDGQPGPSAGGFDPRGFAGASGSGGFNPFAQGFGGAGAGQRANFDTSHINVDDIFGSFFGGGGGFGAGRAQTIAGADVQVSLNVTLYDAYHGAERELNIRGKNYSVKIPRGAANGNRIRFRGQGDPSPITGGKAGDLFVILNIAPDPRFERLGDDLLTTCHIDFPMAALGGAVEVETIDGKVKLKIPAGTQSDRVIKLGGKGMPRNDARSHGDQLVRVVVDVPTTLSPKQREALERFQATFIIAHSS